MLSGAMSLVNSCDARGVNALRWLALSSSRKWEDGEDLLLENRAITIAIIANASRTAIAIITHCQIFDDEDSSPSRNGDAFLFVTGFVPGGGGGAGLDDQEFPPVLQGKRKIIIKSIPSQCKIQHSTQYSLSNILQLLRHPARKFVVFHIPEQNENSKDKLVRFSYDRRDKPRAFFNWSTYNSSRGSLPRTFIDPVNWLFCKYLQKFISKWLAKNSKDQFIPYW